MKQPKSFRHPRVYFSPTGVKTSTYYCTARERQHALSHGVDRIRIVYPDGKIEYIQLHAGSAVSWDDYFVDSCINKPEHKSGQDALRAMRKYDKIYRRRRAIFLGEIEE